MQLMTNCPGCKATLEDGADFCLNCGQEFCSECFFPLDEGETVCQRCGATFALYCPRCDAEVDALESQCPFCNLRFEDPADVPSGFAVSSMTEQDEPEMSDEATIRCSVCATVLYLDDGFCRECGTASCTNCGHAVSDDDRNCTRCGRQLFFDCPNCGFELTTGSEVCPNCDAFLPSHCPHCKALAQPGDVSCSACGRSLAIERRRSARTVRTIEVGERVVLLVACPTCGKVMDPAADGPVTPCPKCLTRVCAICHLALETYELNCPRCGSIGLSAQDAVPICPNCELAVSKGDQQCPHCQQSICPECQAAIRDDQSACSECGVEFEFICPSCESTVNADAEKCLNCGTLF